MVIGFMAAVFVMRRLSARDKLNFTLITNASMYSLIGGVIGARIFFVIHYFDQFRSSLWQVFAIWNGGLEFLGGVILGVGVMVFYLRYNKMPVLRTLDIMAIGLMIALGFGRIGCFLNGCCFGKPANVPWAVRFPYGSFAYTSQINSNPKRGRMEPHLKIPYRQYCYKQGDTWYPRDFKDLTPDQQKQVTVGKYRSLPVHPSQLYACLSSLSVAGILYLIWNFSMRKRRMHPDACMARDGLIVGFMFIFYGIVRYLLELSRDDNPFEYASLTISQIIGIGLIIGGIVFLVVICSMKSHALGADGPDKNQV